MFVLDNSVTMRWSFEDNSQYAEKILDDEIAGEKACVPGLWLYEVISVMAESERSGTLTADKARDFFEDLRSLDRISARLAKAPAPDR